MRTRTRPVFLVGLAVVVLGAGTYGYVAAARDRSDAAARAEAHRLFAAMPDLAGARLLPRKECNADVVRRCTHVPRDVAAVVPEVEAKLEQVTGQLPRTRCDEDVSPEGLRLRMCTVRVSTGRGHGVIVAVDPYVRPFGEARTIEVRGSHVWVTAS